MRILHINVRLQEGGAAKMALDLHRQLLNAGVESRLAYGWGENGGKSSAETSVPYSFQVGQQIQVASNMMLHRAAGIDCVPPVGAGRKSLLEALHWADIVHLHVIHSYFLPFAWLVKELIRVGKPVCWTAHDYWMLTGRCAFTEGCEGWRNGCGTCPTQKNYPAAYFNFSSAQFKAKRQLLADLGSQLHIVTPSKFVAQAIMDGLPDVDVHVIPNWIDSEFEAALQNVQLSNTPLRFSCHKIRVIVMANDLSDPTKVDCELIYQLLEIPHIEIHTVGQSSPFFGSSVVNHGRIAQRNKMVDTIVAADVALFTSEKDTFGLVMIEVLACGVPVLAIQSLAAKEVLAQLGINPIESKREIVTLLSDARLPFCYASMNPTSLSKNVLNNYGRQNAIMKYVSTYERAALS